MARARYREPVKGAVIVLDTIRAARSYVPISSSSGIRYEAHCDATCDCVSGRFQPSELTAITASVRFITFSVLRIAVT
jgi:hypothetical protein